MPALKIDVDRQQLFRLQGEAASRTSSAQEILWREWRNCDDADYARYLFGLLVAQPLDVELAIATLGLVGGLLGAIGGLLVALLGWSGVGAPPWIAGMLVGLIIGVVIAIVAALTLRLGGHSDWSAWLQGFVSGKSLVSKLWSSSLDMLSFVLTLGLSCGVGIKMLGTLPHGQPTSQFHGLFLIPVLFIFSLWYLFKSEPTNELEWIGRIIVGGILGVLFGVVAAQAVGGLAGPLGISNLALIMGLAVGLIFGWCCGRLVGLMGLLIIHVALTGLILVGGSGNAMLLLGWLLGLLAGGVLGSYSRMWQQAGRSLSFEGVYAYRRAFLWWAGRPLAAQVEAALETQSGHEGLLQHLRERVVSPAMARSAVIRKKVTPGQIQRRGWWLSIWRYLASLIGSAPAFPDEAQAIGGPGKLARAVEDLIGDLQAATWQERFVARHALVALGGEAIPRLLEFIDEQKSYALGEWFIGSIGYETSWRLADERASWICPACLTACSAHTIHAYGLPVIAYYGCRACGQSRHLLYCPQGVVAVLDADWAAAYSYQGNRLRANWLVCRILFDFDTVEIVRATDEDVERLAMNIGNDTDPVRKARYAQVRCVIAPECRLSENSLRVLEQVFGQVESTATLQNAF